MHTPGPPPPPPPPAPKAPPRKAVIEKLGYNRAHVIINATFSRQEMYRLIGELERCAGDL